MVSRRLTQWEKRACWSGRPHRPIIRCKLLEDTNLMCIRTPLVHTVEQQSIFLVHFCPSPKQAAEGDVVVVVVAVRAAEAEADKAPKTVANLKKSILFTIEIVDDKGW